MKNTLLFFTAVGLALVYYFATENRRIAGNILKVSLPSSASGIECESWGFTDVLTTCVFDIHPDDFEALLAGWDFRERRVSGSSHAMGGGPKLGQNFDVSTLYTVEPAEFSNGGYVRLVTNRERTKISTDIYVE